MLLVHIADCDTLQAYDSVAMADVPVLVWPFPYSKPARPRNLVYMEPFREHFQPTMTQIFCNMTDSYVCRVSYCHDVN